METILNSVTPQTYSGASYSGAVSARNCTTIPRNGSGGSNIIYKARSPLKRNPKDAYGFRPMSPFEGVEQERKQPYGTATLWKKDTRNSCYDGLIFRHDGALPSGMEYWFNGQINNMSVAGGQAHDLLAMRAEANLKQQDINVLQFAAFLPATLKNIASNLKKMDALLDSLHDPKALKRLLKQEDPRSLYLQWLFVWNQLFRDVVGGARYIMSKARPIGSLVTGRASNTAESEYTTSRLISVNSIVGVGVCDTRMSLSQRAASVARVTCDVQYASNRLGFINPVYLAWDLIKWSWVVDQIVDIGLFISSITSLHGLEFLGTSITDRVVNESTVTVMNHEDRNVKSESSFSPGFSRRKSVKRVVRQSPTKTITVRNPFQNNVMITAAVAAALSMKASKSTGELTSLARQAR